MAVISKGITLSHGEKLLTNLQEIPELGGDAEAIEITTLADAAHMYTDGILNYGDSLAFVFLYEKAQFTELSELEGSQSWKVSLPDGTTCSFSGTASV
jgi:1,2-phenylacetyl-CoA epoxidase catalytic subunit